ncbi:hypothetical protein HT576_04515 [Haloterrigena sp. SYSU A121-1]|uniref:Uncharacterized protein n=1 Tax=Haloterrigena gelatinilytica TaxID=2741724 RepID=A0A8J8KGQ9_9EURY|nr:hypothetical protein [Haloterrigena gelatinilytica]NUB90299.1 hypothetical protein [Haloterrigena gelatinilytica]
MLVFILRREFGRRCVTAVAVGVRRLSRRSGSRRRVAGRFGDGAFVGVRTDAAVAIRYGPYHAIR